MYDYEKILQPGTFVYNFGNLQWKTFGFVIVSYTQKHWQNSWSLFVWETKKCIEAIKMSLALGDYKRTIPLFSTN